MQGTIIIADGGVTNRILLKAQLAPWSYDVQMASRGDDLLRQASRAPPVLIVLSDALPDARAVDLCAQLRALPQLAHVPVIAIARSDTAADRLALLAAGADDVFARPLQDTMLQARVRSLIRAETGIQELHLREDTSRALGFAEAQEGFARPSTVGILTPDPATATRWRMALSEQMPSVQLSALGYRDALSLIAQNTVPDVFVIGLQAAQSTRGLRLLADLRANPQTRHSGILVILEDAQQTDLAGDALDLGAGDLMVHGFDAQELGVRLRSQIAQKTTRDRLRASVESDVRAAVRDPMTGLFNRRYAMPYLTRVIETNLANGRGVAVMVADLDHFKSINDLHGHAAGDAVLTEVAHRLREDLRAEDLIARMGGEEFLIVLPNSTEAEAQQAAERVRHRVQSRPFRLPDAGPAVQVTVSIGVAMCCFECLGSKPAADSAHHMLKMADAALYKAKGAGRNQVTLVNAA